MQIEISSVSTAFKKTDKGGFSTATVEYINEGGQQRKQNVVSFGNPKVFDTVKNATPGQKFEVTITKNGDFSNWSAITPLADGAAQLVLPRLLRQQQLASMKPETSGTHDNGSLYASLAFQML